MIGVENPEYGRGVVVNARCCVGALSVEAFQDALKKRYKSSYLSTYPLLANNFLQLALDFVVIVLKSLSAS